MRSILFRGPYKLPYKHASNYLASTCKLDAEPQGTPFRGYSLGASEAARTNG